MLLFLPQVYAASKCGNPWDTYLYRENYIIYHNVIADTQPASRIRRGTTPGIGRLRQKPARLTLDDVTFRKAEAAYAARDFVTASHQFEKLMAQEPGNPFIVNALARTYYQMDERKGDALRQYERLMGILRQGYLDSEKYSVTIKLDNTNPTGGAYVIDPWFLEAHWKLGTLYLDVEQYQPAAFQILLAYLFNHFETDENIDEATRPLATQMTAYLTEAFFYLKDEANNRHFYCRTLELDRQNTYVQQFRLATKGP
ncbi:MAG: hypothetical protein ACOY5B_11340 [Spirochaetota bacterium]